MKRAQTHVPGRASDPLETNVFADGLDDVDGRFELLDEIHRSVGSISWWHTTDRVSQRKTRNQKPGTGDYLDILHRSSIIVPRHSSMPAKTDLLQGTLDLLVLKVVAQGPLHGYGIAQKILL